MRFGAQASGRRTPRHHPGGTRRDLASCGGRPHVGIAGIAWRLDDKPVARGTPRAISSRRRSQFTVQEILDWADAWHAATGEWPTVRSGEIPNTSDMTWRIVNFALRQGRGGVPAGSTLARLLRGSADAGQTRDVLPFDIPTILGWADAHHARHGTWPKSGSGRIPECPGEKWSGVRSSASRGFARIDRWFHPAALLSAGRSVRMRKYAPPLTERQVLDWADLHQVRHPEVGRRTGPVQSRRRLANTGRASIPPFMRGGD